MTGLLMVTRHDPGEEPEAEPVGVELHVDGRLELRLDDGIRIDVMFDDLLALAMDEPAERKAA